MNSESMIGVESGTKEENLSLQLQIEKEKTIQMQERTKQLAIEERTKQLLIEERMQQREYAKQVDTEGNTNNTNNTNNSGYFDNNIDKNYFQQINFSLEKGTWVSIEETYSEEYYMNSEKKEKIRLINNNSVIMKENLISNTIELKNSPFDIRFSINQEFSLKSYIKSFDKKNCLVRNKTRKSYISNNFKYDLTYVIQIDNNIKKEKYEIEIELLINNETLSWSNKYINDFLECKIYDLIKIVENVDRDLIKLNLIK
jgi:hypothetical protein